MLSGGDQNGCDDVEGDLSVVSDGTTRLWRRALRHVMFQAALVAAHHHPRPRSFADRLRKDGTPRKVITNAVARKLVTIANVLCKSRQKWTPTVY